MGGVPFLSPRERIALRRMLDGGGALVYLRGPGDELRIQPLDPSAAAVVGRSSTADIVLSWDPQVSGHHAVLECLGGEWVLLDNDSRNGTVLDGRRVTERRRLRDEAVITLGRTTVVFRDPARRTSATEPASTQATPHLSPGQRRVLAAMCEPTLRAGELSAPPSNTEIAARALLGVETVRTYLRLLYEAYALTDTEGSRKRLRLVHLAVTTGQVGTSDLETLPPR